jgi:molybdate transport system ATP-binding protein
MVDGFSQVTPMPSKPDSSTQDSSKKSLEAQIRKGFSGNNGFLLDVDFTATPGFTIVLGASGAGKTTLLDCLAGLISPEAGRITVAERLLFDPNNRINIPVAKRRVGYVLQELALFPHLTVQQNTEYGLAHLPGSTRNERSGAMLRDFRIDHLRARRPAEISGGERQRVALARCLVTDPCLLLLDEPLVALDSPTKSKLLDDLRRWNEAHRIPILYVTHSRDEVIALGETVLVIEQGRIVARGTPHEVLSAPLQESVAQLAGFENIFDAVVDSVHEDRGTMTCQLIGDSGTRVVVDLEVPLVRAQPGLPLRVGIRAGDILLAIHSPSGLSARNVIPGKIVSLAQLDMIISARVECGVEMKVNLTLAARDALNLAPGKDVWLIIKTHSCHLMQR